MPTTESPPEPQRAPQVDEDVLAEYIPMSGVGLTDDERWPALNAARRAQLLALRDEPGAPLWTHATGDRLTASDLAQLDAPQPAALTAGTDEPAWVRDLIIRAHATVPRYRAATRSGHSSGDTPLADLPLVTRADLVADAAAHVPVDVPLDRVLEGSSSGHTGAALLVPLHPLSIAADLRTIHELVTSCGVTWTPDAERLALALVVDQRHAFTYASAMQAFPGGVAPLMARVNLDAAHWQRPGDRDAWITRHDPQVISTATLPLLTLLDLAAGGLQIHPLAVINGATHLTPAVRHAVSETWGAPVVDLYALRETGLVAAALPDAAARDAHVLVNRHVHVEIVNAHGQQLPEGERGEIVVTVDENPYLPLLRYRTGDHAALRHGPDGPELVGLEGRAAVRYRDAAGAHRPSVDATQLLQAHGLLAWHLHQDASGAVRLRALPTRSAGAPAVHAAAAALRRWLGQDVTVDVLTEPAELGTGKPRRFTTDEPV